MRPITGDCSCGRFFVDRSKNHTRLYCDECRKARRRAYHRRLYAAHPEKHAEWYIRTRKNNPKWRTLNKKRAKAWRVANREHIRAYNEARA